MEIQKVDQELVRDLRRRGLYMEANDLLNGFYDWKQKSKEQDQKELRTIRHKIWRTKNANGNNNGADIINRLGER